MYNLQHSLKFVTKKDSIFNELSKKMADVNKDIKPDDSLEQSNFMSKISKLESRIGSSLASSALTSRLSTQSKQRLVALNTKCQKTLYDKFYKEIAINKDKVTDDKNWINLKL